MNILNMMLRSPFVIALLLLAGCTNDPDAALLQAATRGDIAAMTEALTEGADINYVNTDGADALRNSAQHNDPEAVRFLLSRGAKISHIDSRLSAPEIAASMGNDAALKVFFERGFSPAWKRADGWTLLHEAAEGNVTTVKLLLEKGAPVDGYPGVDTPLYVAVGTNHLLVVKLLLAAGAYPNYRNAYGNCPLTLAMSEHWDDIAQELRAYGAKECR